MLIFQFSSVWKRFSSLLIFLACMNTEKHEKSFYVDLQRRQNFCGKKSTILFVSLDELNESTRLEKNLKWRKMFLCRRFPFNTVNRFYHLNKWIFVRLAKWMNFSLSRKFACFYFPFAMLLAYKTNRVWFWIETKPLTNYSLTLKPSRLLLTTRN